MPANTPTQRDEEIRKTVSLIAGGYGVNGDARGEIVDDLMHLIKSENKKAREETIKDARTALAIAGTELKNIYSKADTTEKAIPQLRVNYMSQLDTALAALSEPNSKKEER